MWFSLINHELFFRFYYEDICNINVSYVEYNMLEMSNNSKWMSDLAYIFSYTFSPSQIYLWESRILAMKT